MTSDDVVEQRAAPLSREQLVQMLAEALLDWSGVRNIDAHLRAGATTDARELLRVIEENQAALRRPVDAWPAAVSAPS